LRLPHGWVDDASSQLSIAYDTAHAALRNEPAIPGIGACGKCVRQLQPDPGHSFLIGAAASACLMLD
jgi:hypothetical protein